MQLYRTNNCPVSPPPPPNDDCIHTPTLDLSPKNKYNIRLRSITLHFCPNKVVSCLPCLESLNNGPMHSGQGPLHHDNFQKRVIPLLQSQGMWRLSPQGQDFLAAVRPANTMHLCCKDKSKEESSWGKSKVGGSGTLTTGAKSLKPVWHWLIGPAWLSSYSLSPWKGV